MLRNVVLVVILGVLVSSLAIKRPLRPRLVRRITTGQNRYHHDPTDVDMMGLLIDIGTVANVTEVMYPELAIDTTIADTTIWLCTDVSPGPPDYGNYCFNPHYSSTFVNISATLARDTFNAFDGMWTMPNVTFSTFYPVGQDQTSGGGSGTLGFAWPSMQKTPTTYLPYALLEKYGTKKIFTLGVGLNGCESLSTLGTDCAAHQNGEHPYYVPLTATGYWQFAVQGFRFGTVKATINTHAVVASAKGYIGMPNKYLTQMAQTYGFQWDPVYDAYVIECKASSLPDFDIIIDGLTIVIKQAQYIYTEVPLDRGLCLVNFQDSKAYGFGPEWYFGVPLLQSQCVTFDFDNKRIGFTTNTAKTKPCEH